MKIAVVTANYPPIPGGVADSSQRWAQAMANLGAEVVVFTSPDVIEPHPGVTLGPARSDWGFSGMASLVADIAASKPDVILVHYVPHLYHRRGLSLAVNHAVPRLAKEVAPVVTFAHELYYARHEGWWRQPIGWLQRYALWPLFRGSARVVLTVPDRYKRMRKIFGGMAPRLLLLPISHNIDAVPGTDRAAWRAGLGIRDEELALLFLGLAHPSKELPVLGRSLDALAEAGVPAKLVVAGGGRVDHPAAINLGFLSPADAGAALAAADLYLLPLADGASTRRSSLMNALAAGLPLVATAGVNTDVELFEEAPKLVPAGDVKAFTDAVLALARDPEARLALGRAERALYEREFAWEVQSARWWELLAEVIREREAASR